MKSIYTLGILKPVNSICSVSSFEISRMSLSPLRSLFAHDLSDHYLSTTVNNDYPSRSPPLRIMSHASLRLICAITVVIPNTSNIIVPTTTARVQIVQPATFLFRIFRFDHEIDYNDSDPPCYSQKCETTIN